MPQKIFFLLLPLLLLGAGCATEQTTQPSNSNDTSKQNSDTSTTQTTTTEAAQKNTDLRTFTMTAKQWEFEPETITVQQGDNVRLTITSEDVAHGIKIPEFNIDAHLAPGETTTIEFNANKAGNYSFSCNVYCGSGHSNMTGTLIVE